MQKGHASRTAEYMALFRALESSLPGARRLFDDPLARAFLGPPLARLARLAAVPGLRGLVPRLIDWRVPGARSSAVARTRFIDDVITGRVPGQAEQLVVLGSGFDSRAYRLPGLRRIRVFEVDHPDTLAVKRSVLGRVLSALPENVRFVEMDFNQRELEPVMAAAGYRASAPALVLWEGVTNYLTEPAVDAVLRWCSRGAPGSQLLFTYVHRDVITNPDSFVGTQRLYASLDRFGERWTFGIEPGELRAFLAGRGLILERDLGATEYRKLYFEQAADQMRGYEFYRIAMARVGGHAQGADRSCPTS
jgi:methyltransferase (TIGR00027 family)